ncbi:hypothetical protein Lal_00037539 [Lupinus albus]|nr:hypothetical protein Lal_00037539 [Lupinus albus]
MGQMATSLNTLQSRNSDKLPSQTVLNPRNVSAITLRSGKQTEVPTPRTDFVLQKEHDASKRNKLTYLAPRTFWALQVEDVFVFHLLPPPNSVLLLPPWKARSLVLNSFGNDPKGGGGTNKLPNTNANAHQARRIARLATVVNAGKVSNLDEIGFVCGIDYTILRKPVGTVRFSLERESLAWARASEL